MKRVPRGYPSDHPRSDLFRRRGLVFRRELGSEDWLHTPEALERIRAGLDPLLPLNEWCLEHVAVAGFARAE